MQSFLAILLLELRALVRSKALAMLTVASVLWVVLFPWLATGDGTVAGARELGIHYSLAGVFVLLVVSLLASATGSLARERQARRLQLTLVRPVRPTALVLGKALAHVLVGVLVLTASCLALACRVDLSVRCSHVLSPVLPTPREEAQEMYASYISDPTTPKEVRSAKKEIVLRLLEQKAIDHYQTIPTNEVVSWTFAGGEGPGASDGLAVRMRFTNQYDMRQDVVGDFTLGDARVGVSNITQAVLTVPLDRPRAFRFPGELSFRNRGKSSLMLRPRQDIHLLVPADAFGWNLLRAFLALTALLALVVSLGLFLSAGLGRPVAIFVAFVTLIVSEMSPSVIDQYPDGLETDWVDHVGLCISRAAVKVTRPLSAVSPLEALAKDECVEASDVVRLLVVDLVAIPVLLALLSAFVVPRKQDDN